MATSWFTHLECSVPCGAQPLARYDLASARSWSRDSLRDREPSMWRYPDWIIYPTGGGTGIIGMWKAFDELEAIGWVQPHRRPRLVSVQAEQCAPNVRAFELGLEKAPMWENASTIGSWNAA